ncbi:MAG: class I SAM-dependent methyltransferase [Nitrospinota bacterium]|jgi:16S rRNA (guanine527-N7)-methyltransferase|nr:class I SAM-dependent methyltransferase [Nitrospinota bacterium]HJM43815.1 RsmG family class I SAM-dependent methyltransferase [Nitrospinota bacterium]
MNPEIREALASSFARRGSPLDDSKAAALSAYVALLNKWNRTGRLTGVRDPVGIAGRLLPESLDFLGLWDPLDGEKALDVGAGAGVAGIPIGVMFPGIRMTLVESGGRKVAFLKQAVREVGIGDFRVIHVRFERLGLDRAAGESEEERAGHLGGYGAILSRAVAPVGVLAPMVWRLLAPEGRLLIRQGREAAAELKAARGALEDCGALVRGRVEIEGGRIISLGHGVDGFT